MEQQGLALTAVYLKSGGEYIGFIQELPKMNSRGRTLHDAREALQHLAAEVFEEARLNTAQAHPASGLVRESFFIPVGPSPS
jgi:predicted RNase H-like HicB family nuclease